MALLQAGDIRLHVEGDLTHSRGLPFLVFLHGFTLSAEDWVPLFRFYEDRFNPIAVDLIGHGKSSSPESLEPYSMHNCVEQVLQIMNQLNISSAHWVGYSMGGRVLLTLASQNPDIVNSMVLESTTPGFRDEENRHQRLVRDKQVAQFIKRNPIEKFVDRWMAHPVFESQRSLSAEKLERARSIRLAQSRTGLANSLLGMGRGAMPHRWEDLPYLEIPALLLTGEQDETHVDTHAMMHQHLPKSTHTVVRKAGHNIHFERPEKFIEITQQFLQALTE